MSPASRRTPPRRTPARSRQPLLLSRSEHELLLALPTRRATTRLGRWLAAALRPGDLLLLSGNLGAGKTFLTRALCRALEVPPDVAVTSPTFALANPLEGRFPIVHADLYRLGDADEVVQLGLDEERAQALLVVEWGLPYAAALGGGGVALQLQLEAEQRRARLWPHDASAMAAFTRCAEVIGAQAIPQPHRDTG